MSTVILVIYRDGYIYAYTHLHICISRMYLYILYDCVYTFSLSLCANIKFYDSSLPPVFMKAPVF